MWFSGSQESLGRLDKSDKKRKDKERASIYIDRSNSETSKDKAAFYDKKYGKNHHKRQRSWAGNKLLDVEGGGAGGGDSTSESCEFQVLSSDNKTWLFETSSAEVRRRGLGSGWGSPLYILHVLDA